MRIAFIALVLAAVTQAVELDPPIILGRKPEGNPTITTVSRRKHKVGGKGSINQPKPNPNVTVYKHNIPDPVSVNYIAKPTPLVRWPS